MARLTYLYDQGGTLASGISHNLPTRKWMNPIFLTFSLVCMYLVNPFLNSGVPVYNTYVGSGELVSEVRLFVIFMELCLRSHAS